MTLPRFESGSGPVPTRAGSMPIASLTVVMRSRTSAMRATAVKSGIVAPPSAAGAVAGGRLRTR